MKTIRQIKLFVSCPSDIVDEKNSIKIIVDEINKTIGRHSNYMIEILNWKYDTYTDIGSDAQDVINTQLENQYDILVGMLWTKAGTPTKRDKSGTIEEINRALNNHSKGQLIFFRTSSPDNIYDINIDQINILKSFRADLSNRGVLYKEYESIDNFEQIFRINLISLIADKFLNSDLQILPAVPFVRDKYADILDLIDAVENRDESLLDIDMDSIVQEGITYLGNITFSLESMSNSLSFFTEALQKRTNEINHFKTIPDPNLKNIKVQISVNAMADELLEFNRRINEEIPVYAENFKLVGKTYSQLILAIPKEIDEMRDLNENVKYLRDTVKSSLDEIAMFLKTIVKMPPVNSKFNRSKRATELVIKNLTRATLDGLLILDELIEME